MIPVIHKVYIAGCCWLLYFMCMVQNVDIIVAGSIP
jgi:hypothetical protein